MSSVISRRTNPGESKSAARPPPRWLQRFVSATLQWPPGVRFYHHTARALFGLRLHGREHLPAQRPVLLVSNHGSHYDGLFLRVIGRELLGEPIVSVAWGGVRRFPFARAALAGAAFPVVLTDETRDTAEMRGGVLDQIIAHLHAGRSVALAPEGDRYDALAPFRPGAAYAALAAGVPIVPMTLRGVHPLWRTLPWPRRWWGCVTVHLHPAVLPADYADRPNREAVRTMTAVARRRIASMLDYPDSEAPGAAAV